MNGWPLGACDASLREEPFSDAYGIHFIYKYV